MRLRTLLSAAAIGLTVSSATLLVGCGGPRAPLYAPTTVVGDTVLVRVKDAYVKGDKVVVKMWMKNETEQPITVDRDGIALRTPDGRLVPRASGRTTRHEPYELMPGEGRDVHVDFRLGDSEIALSDAVLVLGGVTTDEDPAPRVVGEVALSSEYRIAGEPLPRKRAAKTSEREPGETDDAGDVDEPEEEEEWEIGGAG